MERQPIGWEPDLNDGVRLNIRPFVMADVLRKRPSINWGKDRGKNPPGSPWGGRPQRPSSHPGRKTGYAIENRVEPPVPYNQITRACRKTPLRSWDASCLSRVSLQKLFVVLLTPIPFCLICWPVQIRMVLFRL